MLENAHSLQFPKFQYLSTCAIDIIQHNFVINNIVLLVCRDTSWLYGWLYRENRSEEMYERV